MNTRTCLFGAWRDWLARRALAVVPPTDEDVERAKAIAIARGWTNEKGEWIRGR